jgi:zinc/manganese transport system permease protein
VLALWFWLHPRSGGLLFYLAFAVVVTASVQIVGIYLVFASLIIPALSTVNARRGRRLWAGYLVGAVSYFAGIVVSFWMDLPTGAVIVWSMALVGLLAGQLIVGKRQRF